MNYLFLALSLVIMLTPAVAYPLAKVMKSGRQGLDDLLTWHGKNAELLEKCEDTMTVGVTVLVSLAAMLLSGSLFAWYIQTITLKYNPWIDHLIRFIPYLNLGQVGSYNLGPMLYWVMSFTLFYFFGWHGVKHDKK